MPKTIISDASCIILFDKIGELDLMNKLFQKIIITSEVASEFGHSLPSWFEIQEPIDKNFQTLIEKSVDKGEASVIALAMEIGKCLLIIDDLKGRKFADKLGLTITGTMGLISESKLAGIIPSVKPILMKIKETNFRISKNIELLVLKKSGEI